MLEEESVKHCLFLLDCKNILGSVRNIYGSEARLDFKKLKSLAHRDSKDKQDSLAIAYIDLDNPWISTLSTVLSTVGYKINTYGPKIAEETLSTPYMIVDGVSFSNQYKKVVVASARGDLIPLYDYLQNKEKIVEVMAFEEDLSSRVPKYIDTFLNLDESVLMLNT